MESLYTEPLQEGEAVVKAIILVQIFNNKKKHQ